MAFHYSPKIVTDSLLLYLDAGNTKSYASGAVWYDLTSNNNNGSINGPIFNSSKFGGFLFDGVDDVVDIPAINLVGDFTISQVINLSDLNSGPMPIGGGDYSGGSTYWGYVWFRDFGGVSLTVNGEVGVIFNISPSVWINKLIHYTVTRNGSVAKIYINGVEGDSQTITTDDFTVRAIGKSYDPLYTSDGIIYNTKIYNKALSQQEITQNYNAIKSRYGL